MGTEITLLSIPLTLLIFFWNIWGLRNPVTRRKYLVLLCLGTSFIGFFLVSGFMGGFICQSLLFGSLFYIPISLIFRLVASLAFDRVSDDN